MARAWVVLVVAVGCVAVCDCVAALDAPDEFEVSFGTKKTLGLRLDDHLKVGVGPGPPGAALMPVCRVQSTPGSPRHLFLCRGLCEAVMGMGQWAPGFRPYPRLLHPLL